MQGQRGLGSVYSVSQTWTKGSDRSTGDGAPVTPTDTTHNSPHGSG